MATAEDIRVFVDQHDVELPADRTVSDTVAGDIRRQLDPHCERTVPELYLQ